MVSHIIWLHVIGLRQLGTQYLISKGNMFTNVLQRTCKTFCSYGQMIFAREAHVFNRALLKCKVRCHFPKPREVKRIKVHGWDARMSTSTGRRVLMRRILKGRYDLSH